MLHDQTVALMACGTQQRAVALLAYGTQQRAVVGRGCAIKAVARP